LSQMRKRGVETPESLKMKEVMEEVFTTSPSTRNIFLVWSYMYLLDMAPLRADLGLRPEGLLTIVKTWSDAARRNLTELLYSAATNAGPDGNMGGRLKELTAQIALEQTGKMNRNISHVDFTKELQEADFKF